MIFDRRAKLKARRIMRRQKRETEKAITEADQRIERLFFRRVNRLMMVRRFIVGWTALMVLLGLGVFWQMQQLDAFYLTTAPGRGGVYREGQVGVFTGSSPLFAVSTMDTAVSKLLYSSLFKELPDGELLPELAKELNVSEDGKTYTVVLRDDVRWHDGELLDAEDVVFTYNTIRNPNVRSPLRSGWVDVRISSPNPSTVVFTLPNVLSSFERSMTNGIVPQHILSEIDAEDLRSADFNTLAAVGSGPFALRNVETVGLDVETRQSRVVLTTNDDYFGIRPNIDGVVLTAYPNEDAAIEAFRSQSIQALSGADYVPEDLITNSGVKTYNTSLTSSVMVFFNTSNEFLGDPQVRRALLQSVDTNELRADLPFSPIAVDSPFLRTHDAYNPTITQLPYDLESARNRLSEAGWARNADGILEKDGKALSLRLVSQSLSEYAAITQKLQQRWSELGVEVQSILQPEQDIQSGAIARHEYDVLLYGISIGHDPDVFAYWHSSQASIRGSNGLNLSEFQSEISDEALEGGRTRRDPALRKAKYEPFLEDWRTNAPAIALYQPQYQLVVRGTFEGLVTGQYQTGNDRFLSIADWRIRNEVVFRE